MAINTQFKKGVLELVVLLIVEKKDKYGYELVEAVSEVVDVNEGTIYPILKRLESSKCVVTKNKLYSGRLRKYYRITDRGKSKLREFCQDMDQIMEIYRFLRK